MVPAAPATAVVAILLAQASLGSPAVIAASLQQSARRCFASPAAAPCAAVWDLSAALKEQADRSSQLRCYTSALSVEAMVAMAQRGQQDPARAEAALEALASDCR